MLKATMTHIKTSNHLLLGFNLLKISVVSDIAIFVLKRDVKL